MKSLTLEEQNDILDAKKYAMIEPGTMTMAQLAKAEGYKGKAPRGIKKETQATLNIIKRVVDIMTEHGPVTATELAAHLGIERGSVHSYLTPAKRNGLVICVHRNAIRSVFGLKEPK